MRRATGWVLLALALWCGSPGVSGAAGPDPAAAWTTGSEPLQVDAQSLEARGGEGVVVFEGDVQARQGDLTLQADRVEVRADPQTREIRSVVARGNVRIRKADVVAIGAEAVYDAVTGIVVLTGDPKVWRDRDVVAGERITLHLAENRSVVEGAKAVFFPGGAGGRDRP